MYKLGQMGGSNGRSPWCGDVHLRSRINGMHGKILRMQAYGTARNWRRCMTTPNGDIRLCR